MKLAPDVLTWNDACIPRLAKSIVRGKDVGALPVLADALLDAGCADERLMARLRKGSLVDAHTLHLLADVSTHYDKDRHCLRLIRDGHEPMLARALAVAMTTWPEAYPPPKKIDQRDWSPNVRPLTRFHYGNHEKGTDDALGGARPHAREGHPGWSSDGKLITSSWAGTNVGFEVDFSRLVRVRFIGHIKAELWQHPNYQRPNVNITLAWNRQTLLDRRRRLRPSDLIKYCLFDLNNLDGPSLGPFSGYAAAKTARTRLFGHEDT